VGWVVLLVVYPEEETAACQALTMAAVAVVGVLVVLVQGLVPTGRDHMAAVVEEGPANFRIPAAAVVAVLAVATAVTEPQRVGVAAAVAVGAVSLAKALAAEAGAAAAER
jgi:hypothetical protein